MKGAKRFGGFESNLDTSESLFKSNRMMAGSPFDTQRAETSQPQLFSTSPLDSQRAESSCQHVRALNTQFASWVQTQLQNHPDEVWEDGVQDYLSHASKIMEKFSDVVNWLKANANKGENSSAAGSQTDQKKMGLDIKSNDIKPCSGVSGFSPMPMASAGSQTIQAKLLPDITNNEIKPSPGFSGFSPMPMTSNFATSWSSGSFSNNNKSSFSFGNQSSVPINRDASDDIDDVETEAEQPSSPSVKKTEEQGVVIVHEVKCKLYVKSTDPADKEAWKDKGMGHLTIRCKEGLDKGTKDSKPTVVVRNDVGRLLLNALIYPGIKTNVQKNAVVTIFHTSIDEHQGRNNSSVEARTFLIRTKTEDDRDKLATTIQEYAPTN